MEFLLAKHPLKYPEMGYNEKHDEYPAGMSKSQLGIGFRDLSFYKGIGEKP